MSSVDAFIREVPKVELHLHLVGSASPRVIAPLAAAYPEVGVPTSVEELESWYKFTDFDHFIRVYAQVSSLVRSGEDIAALVEGAAQDLSGQNVRYVEMTVTPYTHVQAGIPYTDVVAGLEAGRTRAAALGVEFAWVYDFIGDLGQTAALATAEFAIEQPPTGLIGFGIGGTERGASRAGFTEAFGRARAVGLASVPHAGESDGPASIVEALDDLHADRIGHGVRAVEDPELLRRLVDDQTPLEVCPSSNVCTGVFASLEDHALPELLEAGAFVTINSDDPPMFSTTLNDEYHRIVTTFGLDQPTIEQLIRNSVDASLMDTSKKVALLSEIDQVAARYLD